MGEIGLLETKHRTDLLMNLRTVGIAEVENVYLFFVTASSFKLMRRGKFKMNELRSQDLQSFNRILATPSPGSSRSSQFASHLAELSNAWSFEMELSREGCRNGDQCKPYFMLLAQCTFFEASKLFVGKCRRQKDAFKMEKMKFCAFP